MIHKEFIHDAGDLEIPVVTGAMKYILDALSYEQKSNVVDAVKIGVAVSVDKLFLRSTRKEIGAGKVLALRKKFKLQEEARLVYRMCAYYDVLQASAFDLNPQENWGESRRAQGLHSSSIQAFNLFSAMGVLKDKEHEELGNLPFIEGAGLEDCFSIEYKRTFIRICCNLTSMIEDRFSALPTRITNSWGGMRPVHSRYKISMKDTGPTNFPRLTN